MSLAGQAGQQTMGADEDADEAEVDPSVTGELIVKVEAHITNVRFGLLEVTYRFSPNTLGSKIRMLIKVGLGMFLCSVHNQRMTDINYV